MVMASAYEEMNGQTTAVERAMGALEKPTVVPVLANKEIRAYVGQALRPGAEKKSR